MYSLLEMAYGCTIDLGVCVLFLIGISWPQVQFQNRSILYISKKVLQKYITPPSCTDLDLDIFQTDLSSKGV